MTVENTNTDISYTGNNSVTVFAYDFLVYSEDHLFVYFDDSEMTGGFTVSGIGNDSGGNVTFDTPPNDGVEIVLKRIVPVTQLIEYKAYGPFPAKANERGLDLGVMIAQQNASNIDLLNHTALFKNKSTEQEVIGPVKFSGQITSEQEPIQPKDVLRLQDVSPSDDVLNSAFVKYPIAVNDGDTVLNVPVPFSTAIVVIDSIPMMETAGDYQFNGTAQTITMLKNFVFTGDEEVEVWLNTLFTTTETSDGVQSYSTVSSMVADTAIASGKKVITTFFNAEVVCLWNIVPSGAGGMSDGTLALNNGLFAKLQIEPVMSVRAFGTYGNGSTPDQTAITAAILLSPKAAGHKEDTYLVTGQLPLSQGAYFDGNNCKFLWNGVAGAIIYEGRDWGVFSAIGVLGSVFDQHVLTANIPEFEEASYPVGDQSNFAGKDDSYVFMFAGSTSTAPELPSYALMTKFIGVTGSNLAALDYRAGWEIPSGLSITYMDVVPTGDITLKNFTIEDVSPDSGDLSDYASAISLAFAYNCHVDNVTGIGFRNPIIFAQYCTDCSSTNGRVERPQATGGGQGYYNQWSYSTRCDTHKTTGYESRHLCDHTKSSYCNVTNCGDTNTADGAYTNHGSYEHDISYYNCVGWHSVASSGPSFGQSAARIHIENGKGSALTASRNVIDLTVINSRFSRVFVNSQGFQADGLTVDDDPNVGGAGFNMVSTTTNLGRTTLSKRPNVINNSHILFNSGHTLCDFDFTGRIVYLNNTHITKVNSSIIGTGAMQMTGGSITGTTSAISLGADSSVKLTGVDTTSFGVRHLLGAADCYFIVDGGKHTNTIANGIYSNRMTSGKVNIEIRNIELDGNAGIIIDMPNVAGTNEAFMDFSHNTFSNGTITIANIYSGAGKLFYTNNLDVGVTRSIATTGGRRLIENNIVA